MFQLDTRYTAQLPVGTISEEGIRRITHLIEGQALYHQREWLALNPQPPYPFLPALPEHWSWQWLVEDGEYRGTFPKRAQKYWKVHYGIKAPASFLSQIGNLARAHSASQPEYYFDFTDRVDWEDGAFGDLHSCWWESGGAALETLMENGGMAIRFYESAGSEVGIGRAWLAEMPDDTYVVFNGYGFPGNATLTIARAFAGFIGKDYRQISLSNGGSTNGLIWINGGIGYAVGDWADIETIQAYDLHWNTFIRCHDCDRRIDEDDAYYGADDNRYCETCFYDRFSSCDQCGGVFYREDVVYTGDERDLCEWCLNRKGYDLCNECGEWYPPQRLRTDANGQEYCDNCQPDAAEEED